MSRADILRQFVAQRLAAASQEILAVVETTVSGYEEEAAGFMEQIDRQKKQLEVLLQPRVNLGTHVLKRGEEEEGDDDDKEPEDVNDQTPSRELLCEQKVGDAQDHMDPQTEALSKNVRKKCPMLKPKCPRGLQEVDFLGTTGQNEPYDILTSDKGRSLRRLELKTGQKEIEDVEEDAGDSSSSPGTMLTCDDTRQQMSGRLHEDVVLSGSSTSPQEDNNNNNNTLTEDANDEEQQDEDATQRKEEEEEEEEEEEREKLKDSDDDWKPKVEAKNGVACNACGAPRESDPAFVLRAWTHADDPGSVCGVCGERPASTETPDLHLQSHESSLCADGRNKRVAANSAELPLDAEGQPHTCYMCHKVFQHKEALKAHRKTHGNKKKTHLCGVCGKSLSDYRSLSRHKMTHSGERPHSCQVCGRSFKLAGTLRQHEKIHTERERSYLCDVCCKMFLTIKQLQIHMRTHSSEKPYHCRECGRGFCTKGALTNHMRIHTGETPYRCPDCGWAFKRKNNLDEHMTIHSGAKPYVCATCGKACARKTHLTIHMRTHNGERPYKCRLCDKAFTQSHCLKTHMKSHRAVEGAT